MSFAAQTKKELTLIRQGDCCRNTELSALVSLNGSVKESEGRPYLDVETENVATARRIYTELKELFGVRPEVVVRKKMRLKKNNVYAVRVSANQMDVVFAGLGWPRPNQGGSLSDVGLAAGDVKRTSCCRKAYLRGAFLAGGSVNDPGSSSYHLELSLTTRRQAEHVRELMNKHYSLHAKLIQRKKGFVVYLKEGDKIVEFLSVIGAHQALLKFEDVRIIKGMRNQVNRLVNCETANLNKTILAAVRQVEVIHFIADRIGLERLPPHLREVAELRLQYPDVNLQELCQQLGGTVSKSGLNHRFRKLEEIAEDLRGR